MGSNATSRKRACDSCHRRKACQTIQCDAAAPQCNWCEHHGLTCTFTRITRPRKQSGAKSTRERIERLEQLLAGRKASVDRPAASGTSPSTGSGQGAAAPIQAQNALPLAPPARSPGASFGKLHFAGYHLGGICSHNGIPFFSTDGQEWIKTRTGTSPAFSTLCALGPPWQNQQHVQQALLSSASSLELPDRHIVDEYFAVFRSSPFRLVFPVVDIVLFRDTIELAYEPCEGHLSAEPIIAKACVFSFLAIMTLLEATAESTAKVNSDACAAKAQFLMPQIVYDTNMTCLEICFMQCMYHLFTGKMQIAAMFHSLACRIVFMLGAHTPSTTSFRVDTPERMGREWRIKTHLRKLFWICYTFDKDISLRTGQPPALDDQYCDLTLPPMYMDVRYCADKWDMLCQGDSEVPLLPGDLRLSIISSKTSKLLYSAEALHKSDAELLRDIRELDDELERWRVLIPADYRPTLSCSRQFEPDSVANTPKMMHIIAIHFEYHFLMATIHHASCRCRAWASCESGEMEGISSSLALSVEASRSTLIYLRAAVHALYSEAFWMIVFYPMSAILTIFCNILLNPLDPKAKDDLELLASAPQLINAMRMRRLTPNEVIHMKMTEEFVSELTRLGRCAVNKASSDANEMATHQTG
ncbi:uncharacterized protein BCR38DRAFT_331904 [Pseudomassariella vexata]|uniref:Zn(2)-C6 fungal-type domain-containing protein n=1 Tax=Pseudomassariella vexata TaxID=1141098 RepID=A0A1Y2EKW5_9PEZI|nr:uncharacterized protein BCR38DRAFT_331904 [Pseudomassariella vexata]ORY72148.1 hypothetical protein BCR38DRAFT_331904 [Pseudomassariella vexata]